MDQPLVTPGAGVFLDPPHTSAAKGYTGWISSFCGQTALELRSLCKMEHRIAMNRDADNLADVQWIAQCARRLRGQWPHADPTSLEETAEELLRDAALRALPPTEAAVTWLRLGIPDEASRATWLSEQGPSYEAA